jgi:hypothetical protein
MIDDVRKIDPLMAAIYSDESLAIAKQCDEEYEQRQQYAPQQPRTITKIVQIPQFYPNPNEQQMSPVMVDNWGDEVLMKQDKAPRPKLSDVLSSSLNSAMQQQDHSVNSPFLVAQPKNNSFKQKRFKK